MSRISPVVPIALDLDEDHHEVNKVTGKVRPAVRQTHTAETVEAMRQGYVCMKCWERQQQPFPEKCYICGYRMGTEQRRDWAASYLGKDTSYRGVNISDELDRLDELAKLQDKGLWLPGDPDPFRDI